MRTLSVIRSVGEVTLRQDLVDVSIPKPVAEFIEWIEVPSEGHVSRARNQGAFRSSAKWLLFIDEDCEIPPEVFQKFYEKASSLSLEEDAIWGGLYCRDCVGGICARAYNWIQRAWVNTSLSIDAKVNFRNEVPAANLLGGVLLIPRHVFWKLKGFNEDIPWAGEETEFLRRAQSNGIKTFLIEGLEVRHQKSLNIFGFIRRARKQGWSKGYYGLGYQRSQLAWSSLLRNGLDNLSLSEVVFILIFVLCMQISATLGRLQRLFDNHG